VRLSAGQLGALRNLAGKKAGDVVGWVKIAAARELTDLGFAARNRSGWEITPSGEAVLALKGYAVHPEAAHATLPFRPREHPPGR
jgi:hypothetical protein